MMDREAGRWVSSVHWRRRDIDGRRRCRAVVPPKWTGQLTAAKPVAGAVRHDVCVGRIAAAATVVLG